MFGYVKLNREQLKPADAADYKRIYCGLCHQLANYSALSRLFLSFDMTFLIFLSAYDQSELAQKCTANQCLKRIPCPDELMDYWACLSIMMVYQKHLNDLQDGKKSSKAYLLAMDKAWNKAREKYPEVHQLVCEALQKNYALEDQKSPDAEKLAGNFGQLAADLVSNAPSNPNRSPELSEVLVKIARLIGEWIYYIDFYDDVEEDLRTGQYNPMLIQAQQRSVSLAQVKEEFREQIDRRVEELQRLCGYLPYCGYQAVVKNVIHEGVVTVTGNIYSGLTANGHIRKYKEEKRGKQ